MTPEEQLASARAQVEGMTDVERALGLWQIITADPDLEGRGPQLMWEDG